MESMVMKLFRQLVELGVFGKSWIPILSKKYLIGVAFERFPLVSDDKQFAVFLNRTPRLISICKNDGDMSQHTLPGMLGEIGGFTRICYLRNGSITWTLEGYGSKQIEDLLNEVLGKYRKSLKLGASVEEHEKGEGYVHYEEGTAVFGLMRNLKANGVFEKTRDPVFISSLESLTNTVAFFSGELDYVLFCNSKPHHNYAEGRVEITQKEGPSLFYDKLLQARLSLDPIVVARYYDESKYNEDTLQRLLQELVNSSAGIMNKVYPLGRGLTQKSIEELFKEHMPDPLGRGLTSEATQKLFKEQNPHMYDAIALSRPGDTGYLFMMDADGKPVHSDGSPLSVNDGKGNLLLGGDAMSFMQKRIQAGLKPEPDDTTTPDWWAQLRALYPSTPFATEEERTAFITKMRKNLPGLMNEDGSWDVMALSGKAQRKAVEDIRQWQVGPKGYIPRERFKDTEEYIAHLERVIELSRMTPEEFAVDSKRSAEELSQMYPTPARLLDPGATVFSSITPGVKPALYIPRPDEPSPFGPDQENYVDNPWLVWKNKQEGYDAQHQGSSVLLREALITQLKTERYRSQVDRESVPVELQTSSGKLSLGWVIHIHYSYRMDWEEVHQFGMQKINELNQTR